MNVSHVSLGLLGAMVLASSLAACDTKKGEPTQVEKQQPVVQPEPPRAPEQPATVPAKGEPERKGEGFEGRISMRLAGDEPATIQYAAKGDKVKVELRRAPGDVREGVSAIIDRSEKKISLLNQTDKKYAEIDVDRVYQQARERAKNVELVRTGEKKTISGIQCENWTLTDGDRKVTACVAKGPAYFDPAALEGAVDIELPAWVERIVEAGHFPLSVTITDASGKTMTAGEVVEWTEGEVEEGDLQVPEGYQKVDRDKLRTRAKEQMKEAAEETEKMMKR